MSHSLDEQVETGTAAAVGPRGGSLAMSRCLTALPEQRGALSPCARLHGGDAEGRGDSCWAQPPTPTRHVAAGASVLSSVKWAQDPVSSRL